MPVTSAQIIINNGSVQAFVQPIFPLVIISAGVAGGGGGAVSSVTGTVNQITAAPTTGAVLLTLPSFVQFPGTWAIGILGYSDTNILWSAQSSVNSYNQVVLQNTNAGATASTNYNVSNNNGTATTNFGEFGMNSSGFTGASVFNQPGYVYLASATTDLAIGTYAPNAIHFVINSGTTDAFTINTSGQLVVPAFNVAGVVHNSNVGVLSSSLITAADIGTNVAWLVGGNTLTGNAIFGDISAGGFTINFQTKAVTRLSIDNTGLATFSGRLLTTSTATLPALNLGSFAGNPSTPVAGDVWYNSTAGRFYGTTVLGTGPFPAYSTIGTINQIAYHSGTAALTGQSTFLFDGTHFTVGSATLTNALVYLAQGNLSSSWLNALRVDPGAPTAITAASELTDYLFGSDISDLSFNSGGVLAAGTRTKQWAAGTVVTQRDFFIRGTQYTGVAATATFTDAYTLFVSPPTAGSNATITRAWAAGFGANIQVTGNVLSNSAGTAQFGTMNTSSIQLVVNSTSRTSIANTGNWTFSNSPTSGTNPWMTYTQTVATSGTPIGILFTGGAHSNNTLSTEVHDWNINLGRTVTWATGNITTQRAFRIQDPTYAFAGASTITDAATFSVDGAPVKGTNAAITNTHAILVQANAVGAATNSYGLTVNAQTGATNNYAAQFLGGKVLFTTSTTTAAMNAGGFTADPSVPIEGDVAYNTTSHLLKFYNGTSWISAGGSGWLVTGTTTITANTTQSGSFSNTFAFNNIIFNPNALSGVTAPAGIAYNGSNHTNLTLSTEFNDFYLNLQRTVQFATGAIALQRAIFVGAPTYAFVGASTITDAAALSIHTAPVGGTNATITNSHSILVELAAVNGGGTVTNSYGLTVNAMTGATNNYSAKFLGGAVGILTSSPVSSLEIAGSYGDAIATLSANTTLDATHATVLVDATGASRTITLPTTSTTRRIYRIVKKDSSANTVTISTTAGGNKVISTQYAGFCVQYDGTSWYIIGAF